MRDGSGVWRRGKRKKGEPNAGLGAGEAQEVVEDQDAVEGLLADYNHLQVQRAVQRAVQEVQEVEAAHNHMQVVNVVAQPYLGTSQHYMPPRTLPDPAAS